MFLFSRVLFALFLTSHPFTLTIAENLLLGILATCLTASANYAINEWLDAEFDRYHPTKKLRPAVAGGLRGGFVFIEYLLLVIGGCRNFVGDLSAIYLDGSALIVMGIIYNVKPLRSKDVPFLDLC